MLSNKVAKVHRVKKRRRSRRLSDRHPKVYSESVVSVSQVRSKVNSIATSKAQTYDLAHDKYERRSSYGVDGTKTSSIMPNYPVKQDPVEPSETAAISIISYDRKTSEIQQNSRHEQSVTKIRESTNAHRKNVPSQKHVDTENIFSKKPRSKQYTTQNTSDKISENDKKLFPESVDKTNQRRATRHRLTRICSKCSPPCCLASVIGSAVVAIGLVALITSLALLTKRNSTTTTTITTTTSTTSTSTSSTTETTTTSSTSSTTSTTSTSTSTSATTSTTATSTSISVTTSTTVTSTSTSETTSSTLTSTSTSVTTSTDSTTTSETTSSTSTGSTTTTVTPPCPATSVGSASIVWTTNSPTTTTYACQAYSWIAPTSGTVSLQFQLQHKPGRWYLDDVSVYHGGTQMLTNGGFETAALSPWIRAIRNGGSCGGQQAAVTSSGGSTKTGTYYLWDGQINCYDQIEQSFNVIAGETYVISFWLRSTMSTGSGIFARVIVS